MMYGRLIGHRTDLDLRTKWWHRLITVVYVIAFAILSILVGIVLWNAAEPPPKVSEVAILETLRDTLDRMRVDQNAAAMLASGSGRFGLRNSDGSISYVSSYGLSGTYCARRPIESADYAGAFLNQTNYNTAYNRNAFVASVVKNHGPNATDICWWSDVVADRLGGKSAVDIIRYEYTGIAYSKARIALLAKGFLALAVAHVVLAIAYYRGLVYVLCGPRPKRVGLHGPVTATRVASDPPPDSQGKDEPSPPGVDTPRSTGAASSVEALGSSNSVASPAPSGVGGWLGLLTFGLLVGGPLLGAGQLHNDITSEELKNPLLDTLEQWAIFKIAAWLAYIGFSAISMYAGWGLWERKGWAVVQRARIALWIIGPVATVVRGLVVPMIAFGSIDGLTSELLGPFIRSLIVAAVWTVYLSRSRRVRATYRMGAPVVI